MTSRVDLADRTRCSTTAREDCLLPVGEIAAERFVNATFGSKSVPTMLMQQHAKETEDFLRKRGDDSGAAPSGTVALSGGSLGRRTHSRKRMVLPPRQEAVAILRCAAAAHTAHFSAAPCLPPQRISGQTEAGRLAERPVALIVFRQSDWPFVRCFLAPGRDDKRASGCAEGAL
jgi:hypothetical protein